MHGLRQITHLAGHQLGIDLPQVGVPQADTSLAGAIQPSKHFQQCRLAAPDRPHQQDALTGLELQAIDVELTDGRFGIGETHALQRHLVGKRIRQQQLLVYTAIPCQRQDLMHHLQGLPDLLPLSEILDALGDGRDHPAAQDAARDQPPHRQQAGLDLPYPNDHGGDIGQSRQAAGAHAGKAADGPLLDAVTIDARRHVLPLLCKTPTGIVGANRLGAPDRVH
ncbi:hypothetical protein D3C78_1319650 [compost metagenome]